MRTSKKSSNKNTRNPVLKQSKDDFSRPHLVPGLLQIRNHLYAMKSGLYDILGLEITSRFMLPTRISAEACLAHLYHLMNILITRSGCYLQLALGFRRKPSRFYSKA